MKESVRMNGITMKLNQAPKMLLTGYLLSALLVSYSFAQQLPRGANNLAPIVYGDVPEGHWARDAVELMSALGILTGYPDATFRGSQSATRYELAVVGARLFDVLTGTYPLPDQLDRVDQQGVVGIDNLERQQLLEARTDRLEQAIENAASLVYVRQLDERLRSIESELNELAGRPLPEPEVTDLPLSAADTVPPPPKVQPRPVSRGDAVVAEVEEEARQEVNDQPRERAEGTTGSQAFQTPSPEDRYWFGVSTSFPLGPSLHFGLDDVLGSVALRASSSLFLGGELDLGISALIDLPVVITPLPARVYGGLGPTFTVAVEHSGFALQAFLGTEVRLGSGDTEPGGVFIEVGPSVELVPALDSGFVARVGFNYHVSSGR
jgi:hypothetical protein